MEIERSFATFQGLIAISEEFLGKQRYVQAAVSAQIGALYAAYNHPGEFASPRLECVLRTIGKRVAAASGPSTVRGRRDNPQQRVLHVLTAAKDVGGDSRYMWRLIQGNPKRCHSVALTYQLNFDVPTLLEEAVASRGGRVHVLDREGADAIQRARALRKIARDVDVVFLHVYVEDVVPVIAFADKAGLPPIVFVVQADHQFWVGVSVCDVFVHLRKSGMRLSEQRRGIDPARMAPLLPIPLDSTAAKTPRSDARKLRPEAKNKIGISDGTVLLLSIARAIKYMPIGSAPSFAEVMIPIINMHSNAVLLVIGPADADEWMVAFQRTGGRIRALGQRSDTQVFYEAADIYLDSFPFASNTSLLEAGSFGLPLVSYFPYSGESAVLGPSAPGLDGTVVRTTNLNDYESTVSRLIEQKDFREKLGECTRKGIAVMHVGERWNQTLEAVFQTIRAVSPMEAASGGSSEESRVGELDLLLNQYYSRHFPLGWVIGWYARHLPYGSRLQLLLKMLRLSRSFVFSMFLPSWMARWVGGRLGRWRDLRVIARWLSAKA